MSKIKSHPREGVVYECYRGFVDRARDRARKGQLFVFNNNKFCFMDEIVMEKASGRGVCIIVKKDEFQDYFCPADSTPKEQVPSIQQGVIYSTIFHETNLWDVVEEYFELLPLPIQEWMKKEMPDRFDKPKVFEFVENDIIATYYTKHTPFIIGRALVDEKDDMKCLVVSTSYTAEIFEGPQGHQCIRFVK